MGDSFQEISTYSGFTVNVSAFFVDSLFALFSQNSFKLSG